MSAPSGNKGSAALAKETNTTYGGAVVACRLYEHGKKADNNISCMRKILIRFTSTNAASNSSKCIMHTLTKYRFLKLSYQFQNWLVPKQDALTAGSSTASRKCKNYEIFRKRHLDDRRKILKNVDIQPGKKSNKKKKPKKNPPAADGRSRAALTIQLPANAIVDEYDLTITATRAAYIKAAEVADLRVADGAETALVVDFGTMVTVNSIRLSSTPGSIAVYAWLGTTFDTTAIVSSGTENGAPYLFSMAELFSQKEIEEVLGSEEKRKAFEAEIIKVQDEATKKAVAKCPAFSGAVDFLSKLAGEA